VNENEASLSSGASNCDPGTDTMRYCSLVCAALVFFMGSFPAGHINAQESSKPGATSEPALSTSEIADFDLSRDAAADIERAVATARKTGKRVLLDVGGGWCEWCHALDQLFREHSDLAQIRDANFVTVKVYYGSDNKNEQVFSRYPELLGIPHFFVLDDNGRVLQSQHVVDLQKDGLYNADKMREFLVKWSPVLETQ